MANQNNKDINHWRRPRPKSAK